MKRFLTVLVLLCFLGGCSSLLDTDELKTAPILDSQDSYLAFQDTYKNKFQRSTGQKQQDINYYVREMMQQIVGNLQFVNSKTVMAVSSFVFLDGSYEYSDIVGKQLEQSFMHEIHKYGIPIVDFKATDSISVTQDGNFFLSKNYLDLNGGLPIRYVLAGTLVKQPTGYLVNARVIGLKSKAVVATAQGKLPTEVVNSLISSRDKASTLLISN